MLVEKNVPLQSFNTFGIVAKALSLIRLQTDADVAAVLADAALQRLPKFILGGGSNVVITGDVKALVLKVEIMGKRLVRETDKAWIVEAGAGENWHEFVSWTLENGFPGLENLALIPGTVGAAPVQNIGAYGVELQDRFDSLDAVDLATGKRFTLDAAQCAFGYRDSVFKHASAPGKGGKPGFGLAGKAFITHVRLALPKNWKAVLGYADIDKKIAQMALQNRSSGLTALQIYEWVCDIRRAKLPDWTVIGNAGSFFKNPTVTSEQCADIIQREPRIVHYKLDDGSVKLAAGWLIDACGWKGKSVGNAGVYERQALVLINRGGKTSPVTGGEVMTLAKAIQTSVYERFGILLEHEPVVV
jgi:UDP-N-acetylmuramate dehydrogenase